MSGAAWTILGPAAPLRGEVRVPGCKAISHRALIFAALAEGVSHIEGLAPGDDVARTHAALRDLGVEIGSTGPGSVTVTGRGSAGLRAPGSAIDCGNSGTTMRFLAGLAAGLPFDTVLTGDASLHRRPMRRIVDPLRSMGARIDGPDGAAHAPLTIRGGDLHGRHHDLDVASGQVKTALALAGLHADGVTVVHEPIPSRDDTELMLSALGVSITRIDSCTFRIARGTPVPFDMHVPGDPSSAAYFAVAAAIVPGSELVLRDLALNPTRLGFASVLRRMGAGVEIRVTGDQLGEAVGDVIVTHAPLHATVIEGGEIPTLVDELPVLAVAAAFADGVTEIREASEMRVKESDRIATTVDLLQRLGVRADARPDGLVVAGGTRPVGARVESHGDHRIALTGAIAALGALGETTIGGWDAVAVSYPAFADDLLAVTGPR